MGRGLTRRQAEPLDQALLVKGLRIQIVQHLQVSTPSSSVHTNYTSAIEQSILQIAHNEGNRVH